MYARKENNKIKVYNQLPKNFGRHLDFRSSSKKEQERAGFYPIINPILAPTEQKGAIVKVPYKKQYTYKVVAKPTPTVAEIAAQKSSNRNVLLDAGVDVLNNAETYHFTEPTLNNFITATQLSEKIGLTLVKWKTAAGLWVEIPIAEAYNIAASGMQQIQQIYIDN